MKKVSLPLTISLMIVTYIIGLVGGYYISPAYQQTMYVKEEMGLGQADRYVDLRYVNRMIAHHRGAILLADQVANTSHREEIRMLAQEIQRNEPTLIADLYKLKKDWYNDGRIIKDPEVISIGAVDETFDLRFLNALIAHHEAGIEMAKEIKTKSSREKVLDNADTVENFLSNSLVTLKDWREAWYGIR